MVTTCEAQEKSVPSQMKREQIGKKKMRLWTVRVVLETWHPIEPTRMVSYRQYWTKHDTRKVDLPKVATRIITGDHSK